MKLAVKKTYCSNCRRLVKGQEQKLNQNIRILCPKCGGLSGFGMAFSGGMLERGS